jgi:hypothetical protein
LLFLGCLFCISGVYAQITAPIQGVTRYFIVNKGNGLVLTNSWGHNTMQRPTQENLNEIYELRSDGNGGYNLFNVGSNSYLYVADDGWSMVFSETLPDHNASFTFEPQGTENYVGIKTAKGYLGADGLSEGSWTFGDKSVAKNGQWFLIPYNTFSPVTGVAYRLVEHTGKNGYVFAADATNINSGTFTWIDGTNAASNPLTSWCFEKAQGTTNQYYVSNLGRPSCWLGIQNTDDPSGQGTSAWWQEGFWTSRPYMGTSDWRNNEILWQIFRTDSSYYALSCQNTISFTQCLGAEGYGSGCWSYPSENLTVITTEMTDVPNSKAMKFDFVPQPVSCTLTGAYGTVVLPFNADVPEGVKVYSCDSVSGDRLVLTQVTSMEAYKPYIIEGESGSTYTFDVATRAAESVEAPYTDGLLVGNFAKATVPASDAAYKYYVLQDRPSLGGVAFYYAGTNPPTMERNSCYMKIPVATATSNAYYFGSTNLSAGKYYQIANAAGRGNLYFDAGNAYNVVASTGQTGESVTTDPQFNFGIVDTLGATYLFCQENMKFITPVVSSNGVQSGNAQEFGEYWQFTDVPTPVTISYNGHNTYKISAVTNNVTKILSVDNRYFEPVVTYYAQNDAGYPMTFTKVGDINSEELQTLEQLIFQNMVTGISNVARSVVGYDYYGTNGTKLHHAVRGVNIVKVHFSDGSSKVTKIVLR